MIEERRGGSNGRGEPRRCLVVPGEKPDDPDSVDPFSETYSERSLDEDLVGLSEAAIRRGLDRNLRGDLADKETHLRVFVEPEPPLL